jgi:hypothetical protein
LQKDISDITEQYKTLTSSIENMNKWFNKVTKSS